MRSHAATLIDSFELAFPMTELPLPAIERYRLGSEPPPQSGQYAMVPMQSLDLEVDFDDTHETDALPPSSRLLRARCWASED